MNGEIIIIKRLISQLGFYNSITAFIFILCTDWWNLQCRDQHERPSALQLLDHPFVKGRQWIFQDSCQMSMYFPWKRLSLVKKDQKEPDFNVTAEIMESSCAQGVCYEAAVIEEYLFCNACPSLGTQGHAVVYLERLKGKIKSPSLACDRPGKLECL